jgi:hypothetical protein
VSAFAVSQILVAVVFVIALGTFQFRERKHVLLCCVAITILIGAHFLLVDAYTAGVLAFIASVRYTIAIYSRSRSWMYLFLVVVVAMVAGTYDGLLSVLAGTGSILTTLATFKSNKALREISLLASVVWILHNLMAGSPAAFVLEIFFLGSNLVGYYRYFWKKPAVAALAD